MDEDIKYLSSLKNYGTICELKIKHTNDLQRENVIILKKTLLYRV